MPVMDGLELGKKLEQVCSHACTIYMSGYNDDTESFNDLVRSECPSSESRFRSKNWGRNSAS